MAFPTELKSRDPELEPEAGGTSDINILTAHFDSAGRRTDSELSEYFRLAKSAGSSS